MSLERLKQGLQGKGPVVLTLPIFNRLIKKQRRIDRYPQFHEGSD